MQLVCNTLKPGVADNKGFLGVYASGFFIDSAVSTTINPASPAPPPMLINPAVQGKEFVTTAAGSNIQAGAMLNIARDIYPLP